MPDPMPSKLPITLAQLQADNNSQTLKIEIRHLLYSLYCSKKIITETVYYSLIKYIQNVNDLMNTKNGKANEAYKFRLSLTDNLNLKDPHKKYGVA